MLKKIVRFYKFLKKVSLKFTILFIKGNHDKIYGKRIRFLIENISNCYCLDNCYFTFKTKKEQYNFSSWKNKNKIKELQKGKNIVLIHNPEKIIKTELNGIALLLAGHLHGGQFIFFKTKNHYNFPACLYYKYCIDRVTIKNTVLIVSKGLGDTFPFRVNCSKEVVNIYI